jgi:hypothetical protein
MTSEPLILKRAPIGWNQDDSDVLANGILVGRIFLILGRAAAKERAMLARLGHLLHQASNSEGNRAAL